MKNQQENYNMIARFSKLKCRMKMNKKRLKIKLNLLDSFILNNWISIKIQSKFIKNKKIHKKNDSNY